MNFDLLFVEQLVEDERAVVFLVDVARQELGYERLVLAIVARQELVEDARLGLEYVEAGVDPVANPQVAKVIHDCAYSLTWSRVTDESCFVSSSFSSCLPLEMTVPIDSGRCVFSLYVRVLRE